MDNLDNLIKKFKYEEPIFFNEENFNIKADEDRYNNYLDAYVLKYVDDKDEFKNFISEQRFLDKGIFETIIGSRCVVTTRLNLQDEIDSIKLISKFVNYKNANNTFDYSIAEDVISSFNQYDYLKNINQGFAELYMLYRKSIAFKNLNVNDIKKRNSLLPEIYSYFLLLQKKDDYDIDLLNKINSSSKTLSKTLKKNHYDLN